MHEQRVFHAITPTELHTMACSDITKNDMTQKFSGQSESNSHKSYKIDVKKMAVLCGAI